MGMGFGSCHADCIEGKTLAKLFPKEYKALTAALKKADMTLDGLAQNIQNLDAEDDSSCLEALGSLRKAFAKKFSNSWSVEENGLSLELGFHNQGDRYDEVNGAFWAISGLYVLSTAAKQLGEKNFERKFYVTLS
jgi:hypothetical protein